jgi:hypothetical protein
MADAPVVHIGENSPEYVAYLLMKDIIISVEDKRMSEVGRKALLDIYAECLHTIRNPGTRLRS